MFRSILDYDINIYPLLPQDRSYTALNMNYSVAGFQVNCLVINFRKGLLAAIYAGKRISGALEDERETTFL